jgi:hypothetical protein
MVTRLANYPTSTGRMPPAVSRGNHRRTRRDAGDRLLGRAPAPETRRAAPLQSDDALAADRTGNGVRDGLGSRPSTVFLLGGLDSGPEFARSSHGFLLSPDKIARLRPAHREYIAQLFAEGTLVAGGPFTDGSGALFIHAADSLAAAEGDRRCRPIPGWWCLRQLPAQPVGGRQGESGVDLRS